MRELFEQKLKEEYEKKSLFNYLKENCNEDFEQIETIQTDKIKLNSLNYVLEHPNTDLEKYYIKEIVNILVQNEIRVLLPFLEKFNEDIVDEAGKVVIGTNGTSQAKLFHHFSDKEICFDLNKIYVDDTEILLSDFSTLNFDMGCDTTLKSFIMIGGKK